MKNAENIQNQKMKTWKNTLRGFSLSYLLIPVGILGVLAVGALVLGNPSSCINRDTTTIRHMMIDVDQDASKMLGGLTGDSFKEPVEEVAKKTDGLRVVLGQTEGAVARVRIERADTHKLAVSVELSGVEGGVPYQRHGYSVVEVDDAHHFRLEDAITSAFSQVVSVSHANNLDNAQLYAWIDDKSASVDQKREAIRVLSERHDKEAAKHIINMLPKSDENLVPHAFAALKEIGNNDAVPAIIQACEGRSASVYLKAIDSVRALGTYLGAAWLFTISTGHQDEFVQQASQEALKYVEATHPQLFAESKVTP